jgi:hypothetical protein
MSVDYGALPESFMAFLPRVLNWIETLRPEESSLEDVFALTMTQHGNVWTAGLGSLGKDSSNFPACLAFCIF